MVKWTWWILPKELSLIVCHISRLHTLSWCYTIKGLITNYSVLRSIHLFRNGLSSLHFTGINFIFPWYNVRIKCFYFDSHGRKVQTYFWFVYMLNSRYYLECRCSIWDFNSLWFVLAYIQGSSLFENWFGWEVDIISSWLQIVRKLANISSLSLRWWFRW